MRESDRQPLPNPLIQFARRHLFTRENAWALLIAVMLLLIFVLGTMGVQPKFVYGGF